MNAKIFYFVNHTANYAGNTGIQRVTRQLGRALAEHGREVVLVSWLSEKQAATRSSDDELRRLARWNGPAFRAQGASGRPLDADPADRNDLAGSWLIVPECPYHGTPDADATLALIEYAHRVGLKIAFIFHDLIPIKMRGYESLRDRHLRYVRQMALADLIIPVSRYSGVELERHYRTLRMPAAELPQIICCPLPEEFPGRRRVEVAAEPAGETIRIVSLGVIEARKNQYKLLQAFNGLCAEHPELNVRLTLIGDHHPSELRKISGLLRHNPRADFVGPLSDEDVLARHDDCHFTAVPSVEEGYGLPIVESLWLGKPCLCANFGAMAEAAEGGGCLTVDTRSVDALKNGLERLSTDRAFRRDLARKAAARPMRSWRDYAGTVLAALDRHIGIRQAYYWVDFTVRHPVNTGVQRVTRVFARSLESLGIELEYVWWDYDANRFAPLDDERRRHLAKWNGPVYRPPQPLSQHYAGKWLIVPEIISPPQPAAAAVIRYARARGMKTAFLFYDLIPLKHQARFSREFTDGFVNCWRMMREADVILPISRAAGEDLARFYAQDCGRTAGQNHAPIIPCPLPGEFVATPRVRQVRARDGDGASLLCVGTIDPRKNQMQLVTAIEQLRQAGQADGLSLTIVGTSHAYPELAAELERRIADLPNVAFLDHVDDATLQELYARCDFTVYASCEEGFGLPVMESLWNGRPCLCHNAGAIAEVAAGGGCYMVDMGDTDALRTAILRLSRDRELYGRLAAEAVNRPIKTWSDYAGEIAGTLAQRMGRPTGRVRKMTTVRPPVLIARIPDLNRIYAGLRRRARALSSRFVAWARRYLPRPVKSFVRATWERTRRVASAPARPRAAPPAPDIPSPPMPRAENLDPFERMRAEIAQVRRDWPTEPALSRNVIDYDRCMFDTIRATVLKAGGAMFSWEGGERDLEDHVFRRLELDRAQCVPWLCSAFPLAGARVLEIGCGTGASTVALAEQGCKLTAIDIDAQSLAVADTRCRAMGLTGVDFRLVDAVDIGDRFSPASFDCVIFFASLEHMAMPDRRRALAAAWSLLPAGGHLVITDTPNRLWNLDEHTSFLPFFHWLPDDMAAEYMQKFSPRKDLVADIAGKGVAGLYHAGRGVSFHEIDLAITPVKELQVLVGKDEFLRNRHAALARRWNGSDDQAYAMILRRMLPGVPAAFFERSIEVIIRKQPQANEGLFLNERAPEPREAGARPAAGDALAEREARIAALGRLLAERDSELAAIRNEVAQTRLKIGSLEALLAALYASTSWRVSAPLRAAKSFLDRVRDRILRVRARSPAGPAAQRVERADSLAANYPAWQRARLAERLAAAPSGIWNHLITVVVFAVGPDAAAGLAATLTSLRGQHYRNIEVLVAGVADDLPTDATDFTGHRGLFLEPELDALNILAAPAADRLWRGSHVVVVRAGSEFAPDAFALFNAALTPAPGDARPDLVLCDHDRLTAAGELTAPSFAPGWDPDLICAFDYIETAFLASRALVLAQRPAGRPASLHEWLCGIARGLQQPVTRHIAEPLVHMPANAPQPRPRPAAPAARSAPAGAGMPAMAIVVPHRNQPELLQRCLGFLEFANRFRLELVIVDNASDVPAVDAIYDGLHARHGARIVCMNQPFNFSRMVNLGVAASSAEVVLLLNNDVEITAPGLLEEMLANALRPEVGVVGSRLLYPDRTVQHAGMILRPDPVEHRVRAQHVLRGAPDTADGYLHQLRTIRNYQCVTGALMAMRREVFAHVSGFDEVSLPVAFGDVDFCLRVRRAGWRVIALPLDGVIHVESATRGTDWPPAAIDMWVKAMAVIAERWPDAVARDPFRNPWVEVGEVPHARFPWSTGTAP
jgi:glycosyltransferase involved in cell wall biosynthesis/GT2 family glycosyltransferase/2-polyprenyl-3-methyl-5-hydroxy-6-metoxy-1,4-benzoquinol methylase